MKKRISLEEKGNLTPIIINILVVLLTGAIPIFFSEFSAIIYIINTYTVYVIRSLNSNKK